MNTIRKNALKVMVLVALFSMTAFAEGEMGGGGLADTGEGTKTLVIRTSEGDGEMGGGGKLLDSNYFGSVLTSIFEYFDRTF